MFFAEKFIVDQKAKLAFEELSIKEFDFARYTKNIPLVVGGSPSAVSSTFTFKTPKLSSCAMRENKLRQDKEYECKKRKRQQACTALVALDVVGNPMLFHAERVIWMWSQADMSFLLGSYLRPSLSPIRLHY